MECINEATIAVTVRRTSVNGSIMVYRTYWLHVTHPLAHIRNTIQEDQTATSLSAYTLCPSVQILLDAGSILAELLNALKAPHLPCEDAF